MEHKYTAVNWLQLQIKNSKYFYKLIEDINSRSTIAQSNIFEQAKEMEKEQMIKFTNDYLFDDADLTAEQYYNQTFKQD
jgi:hypothetical protein